MNNSEYNWICRGTKPEPHPEFEIEANHKCDICGQDEASAKSRKKKALPIGIVSGAIALILLGSLGLWWFSRPKSPSIAGDSQTQPGQLNGNSSNNTSLLEYSWQPDRFTRGQRTLFTGKGNPSRDNGIEAFKQGETSGREIQFSSGERQSEPVLVKAVRGGSVGPTNSDFGFELVNE